MVRNRRRSWVKLWITGWLHGSIRWQLEPEERGVWADILALAGECGREGALADNDGEPLPRKFMANQFNIPITLLDRVIAKCIHDERLELSDLNGQLSVTNWNHYQSEYDRQKQWRQRKEEDAPPQQPRPVYHKPASDGIDYDFTPLPTPKPWTPEETERRRVIAEKIRAEAAAKRKANLKDS